jgi:4-hydroxy-tetrahydrodipicolinate reductase
MLRVCFAGVTGWTAAPIVRALEDADDLALVGGVSRSAAGQTLTDTVGTRSSGLVYGSVAAALDAVDVDVVVDYTTAEAVAGNVWTAVEAGKHVVVGSSGLTSDDFVELDRLARDRSVGVVAAGNFSVMGAVLRRAAELAARQLEHWEIIDYAGATKSDVPSGTSREVAETLAQVRRPESSVPISELTGPREARGAEIAGSRVHSVRLPGFVVTTEVVFSETGERLVLRHDAGNGPEPYAEGTLLAIRKVADIRGVRRGLDSLLFPGEGS